LDAARRQNRLFKVKIAILKSIGFQTLFAIGMVALTAYILYIGLKIGAVFGKWPGQVCKRSENPIGYWVGISVYAFIFACSLWILYLVIKDDIVIANWPTISN
jgi:hypothetical protein